MTEVLSYFDFLQSSYKEIYFTLITLSYSSITIEWELLVC